MVGMLRGSDQQQQQGGSLALACLSMWWCLF
jgi:hypothetical protein